MADIRPFKGYRPNRDICDRVAALPYDVYNRKEAKTEVSREPLSFLKIDRPEANFDDDFDMYSEEAYQKASELLNEAFHDGTYIHDDKRVYYIYELIMDGRHQTGIAAVSSIDDYRSGVIKKHENTRAEKEVDRINHIYHCKAQTGPIFLAYRDSADINAVVAAVKEKEPEYSFTSPDAVTHNVWIIDNDEDISLIQRTFGSIDSIYIADGHHRAASAVKVGGRLRAENPGYTGEEEYNFFLSVLFPESELKILPYNRVVKDLNGLSKDDFLKKISEVADIEVLSHAAYPENPGKTSMCLDKVWYLLTFHEDRLSSDPVDGLDVSVLQNSVLEPILGIDDPRTSDRIDFVGGIRGLEELERRIESDMRLAFAMYPTTIEQLFGVADAGLLMPPKSTWFEPKLRSGIFIHRLEDDED